MTHNVSPFDHRPDPELAAALRDAVSAGDDARFVRQVLAAADGVYGERLGIGQWWSALVPWAQPGLVAAMLLIALGAFSLGLWVGRSGTAPVNGTTALGDPLRSDSEQMAVPLLLSGQQAPRVDEVLAAAIDR